MFRANTVDSKMFKYFALLVASQYLWEVLAEFVWEIQKDGILRPPPPNVQKSLFLIFFPF